MSRLIVGLLVLGFLMPAQSEDFPLSEPLGTLQSPLVDETSLYFINNQNTTTKSDLMAALKYQTKVKSQGQRNTCTVFAITALIESLFLARHTNIKTVDFSEQWLQYLVALRSPSGGANGSTVLINFGEIKKFGFATEEHMPYNSSLWTEDSPQANSLCSGLSPLNTTRCLMSQTHPTLMSTSDANLLNKQNKLHNPRFVAARQTALESRSYLTPYMKGFVVGNTSAIKQRLRNGSPMTLEINIYYGSWNHGAGESLGIDIDNELFRKGIITYPEKKSVDLIQSPKAPARHAVEIVGYDDSVEMTYTKKMQDGTTKTFTRKGVYYFKNSWGTHKFGSQFKAEGKKIPGFGMITQDYAHHYGQFFAIDLAPGQDI